MVFGFVEEKPEEKGLFYNSAAFCRGAARSFTSIARSFCRPSACSKRPASSPRAGTFRAFDTPWGRMGLLICRDFLHFNASYLLFAGGAEMMIVSAPRPGGGSAGQKGFASSRMWELMGEAMGRFAQAFVVYCNRVGLEDGVVFAGGSFVYDPMGEPVGQAATSTRISSSWTSTWAGSAKPGRTGRSSATTSPRSPSRPCERIVHGYDD